MSPDFIQHAPTADCSESTPHLIDACGSYEPKGEWVPTPQLVRRADIDPDAGEAPARPTRSRLVGYQLTAEDIAADIAEARRHLEACGSVPEDQMRRQLLDEGYQEDAAALFAATPRLLRALVGVLQQHEKERDAKVNTRVDGVP